MFTEGRLQYMIPIRYFWNWFMLYRATITIGLDLWTFLEVTRFIFIVLIWKWWGFESAQFCITIHFIFRIYLFEIVTIPQFFILFFIIIRLILRNSRCFLNRILNRFQTIHRTISQFSIIINCIPTIRYQFHILIAPHPSPTNNRHMIMFQCSLIEYFITDASIIVGIVFV